MNQVQTDFEGVLGWNGLQRTNSSCLQKCLYVYSSAPKPMPAYGRPIFRNNVPKPRGIGDFYNVMWDGRVRRGKANPPEQKSFIQCFNVRKPKTLVRQPRIVYERPPTPPHPRRSSYEGQVESHMEELNPDFIEDESAIVDFETALDLPTCPSCVDPRTGIDVVTEILPGDLFDFDHLVVPVCEALVGQVLHRSLLELLDEEELESLRTQQAQFEETRSTEQLILLEMKEQYDRLEAERLAVVERAEQYRKMHEAATNRIEAVAFSSFYLGEPIKNALDSLLNNNSIAELRNIITSIFNPWVNKQVELEVEAQSMCRNLFEDILRATVQKRESEYDYEQWKRRQDEIAKMQFSHTRDTQYEYWGEDG